MNMTLVYTGCKYSCTIETIIPLSPFHIISVFKDNFVSLTANNWVITMGVTVSHFHVTDKTEDTQINV